MNIFKRYTAYVKDNPKGYWFKRKWYGWGWTPVKWQGWLTTAIFIALLVVNGIAFSMNPAPTNSQVAWFLIRTALIAIALILVCYRTGEKPKWQWGIPDEDGKKGDMR